MKFAFAIGVVALHAHPLKDFSPFGDYMITQCFTRIGVPFFFVAAGYFLFSKMSIVNLDKERIKKYIIRIFTMWVIWTLIYIPIIMWSALHHEKGFIWGIGTKIYVFIVRGDAEFHLWFLHALMIAVLLLSLLIKLGWSFKKIFLGAGMLHIIALLGGAYYFAYLFMFPEGSQVYEILHGMTKFMKTTNGFTVGLLYVSIGAFIGFFRPVFEKNYLYKGFFISWTLFIIEAASIKIMFPFIEGSTPYFFLIPATIFTFLLGLNIELKNKPLYMTMRKMSMFIYFAHTWFLFLVGGISKRIHPIDSLTNFIIVAIFTLLTARIIVFLSAKKKSLAVLG